MKTIPTKLFNTSNLPSTWWNFLPFKLIWLGWRGFAALNFGNKKKDKMVMNEKIIKKMMKRKLEERVRKESCSHSFVIGNSSIDPLIRCWTPLTFCTILPFTHFHHWMLGVRVMCSLKASIILYDTPSWNTHRIARIRTFYPWKLPAAWKYSNLLLTHMLLSHSLPLWLSLFLCLFRSKSLYDTLSPLIH